MVYAQLALEAQYAPRLNPGALQRLLHIHPNSVSAMPFTPTIPRTFGPPVRYYGPLTWLTSSSSLSVRIRSRRGISKDLAT